MSERRAGDRLERLRTDRDFPGRTFTEKQIDEIERRAREGEWRRKPRRWLLTGSIAATLCLAGIVVWLASAQSFPGKPAVSGPGGDGPPGVVPTQPPSATATPPPSGETQDAYSLKGAVRALLFPGFFASGVSFEADPSASYALLETDGDYARIRNRDGEEGWIPRWYLLNEEEAKSTERIKPLEQPYEMIVTLPATYHLSPGGTESSGFELWPGKVVQVVATFGNWVEVNFVTYDSPYAENKWMMLNDGTLVPYEDDKAKEGYVYPAGETTPLYDENGAKQDELRPLTNVYIRGELGDRYLVTAAGGVSGYMEKTDFRPNPYSIKVVDQ